jgi:hypothetical protein
MKPSRYQYALASYLALAALAAPAGASQDVFHIHTPVVEDRLHVELLSAFNFGNPSDAEESIDEAYELAIGTGITKYWMAYVALGVEKPDGETYDVSGIEFENVFRLYEPRSGFIDAAWFTSVGFGFADDAPNAIEFGPIVTLAANRTSLVLNPFFEKTFGDNREEGIAFTYAWRAAHEFSDRFAIGVEGYGAIENIGEAPAFDEQTHRIGPVLYLGGLHGSSHHGEHAHSAHAGHGHDDKHSDDQPALHAEIGVLFGITDATPDTTLKVNIGADF